MASTSYKSYCQQREIIIINQTHIHDVLKHFECRSTDVRTKCSNAGTVHIAFDKVDLHAHTQCKECTCTCIWKHIYSYCDGCSRHMCAFSARLLAGSREQMLHVDSILTPTPCTPDIYILPDVISDHTLCHKRCKCTYTSIKSIS